MLDSKAPNKLAKQQRLNIPVCTTANR